MSDKTDCPMKHLPVISILLLVIAIVMRWYAASLHDECSWAYRQVSILERIHNDNPEILGGKLLPHMIEQGKMYRKRMVGRMDSIHFFAVIPIFFGLLTGVAALIKRQPANRILRSIFMLSFISLLWLSILSFIIQV